MSSRSRSGRSTAQQDKIQKWATVKQLVQNELKGRDEEKTAPTLSHGFQNYRTTEIVSKHVKEVLYIPSSSSFLALDKDYLNIFKGNSRSQKIPISNYSGDTRFKVVNLARAKTRLAFRGQRNGSISRFVNSMLSLTRCFN